jgi:hypothetical protein
MLDRLAPAADVDDPGQAPAGNEYVPVDQVAVGHDVVRGLRQRRKAAQARRPDGRVPGA